MLTKQQISDRFDELEKQAGRVADAAFDSADRQERIRQADERKALQVQCSDTGGHYFGPAHFPRSECLHCGADKNAAQNQLSANVLKG